MLVYKKAVDERLGWIVEGMVKNLEEGHIAGEPIKAESRSFVKGVAAGVEMAQAAVAAMPPVDLTKDTQN
jgi:hypothetical protein